MGTCLQAAGARKEPGAAVEKGAEGEYNVDLH
jgi:hypothetical protein